MPQIFVHTRESTTEAIGARAGFTLMETLLNAGIEGIEAECGGACACATCHVYVDEAWQDIVGLPTKDEIELLEEVAEKCPTSRLSCQITLSDDMDGLAVTIPSDANVA
jgi:2Fe-2S ferredoxin